ncbi:uncharacterized protein BDZ99DRAFT_523778 [Mytilinidion resinicola]|uniref:Uncharacterized protein n=1 Tax=Mytilinidion resinicola TaxID=574789 RepID=A0A6A6YEN5_9PEZI|nr:uncharacterized protein BDZ99DRAFT_523778 [Mytilinidion resinicola]KAF2806317.1 hypothetical protein BDZ99DRAFT_523778 [Mytilinidion resinicola]
MSDFDQFSQSPLDGVQIGAAGPSNFLPSPPAEAPPGFVERAHSCDNCHANRINKCDPAGASSCRPCQLHGIVCSFNPARKLARSCLSCTQAKSACMAGSFTRCLRCLTSGTRCYMRDYQSTTKTNRSAKRKFLHYDPETGAASDEPPQHPPNASPLTPKRLRFTAPLTASNFDAMEPLFDDDAALLSALEVPEASAVAPSFVSSSPAGYISPYSPRPSAYPTPAKTSPASAPSSRSSRFSPSPCPLPAVLARAASPFSDVSGEAEAPLPPLLTTGDLQEPCPVGVAYFSPGCVYPEPYYMQPAYAWAPYAFPVVYGAE